MAFYLTVTSGADEGRSVRIESGDCLIGRSPKAALLVQDDSIAWEHATIRVDGGKAVLRNLSALGTHVKGRPVVETVRLGNNDEIRLSPDCTVLFQQRLGRGPRQGRTRRQLAILGAILFVVVAGGALTIVALRAADPPQKQRSYGYTDRQGRTAYHRIAKRLKVWTERGDFPEEAFALYEEAWRLEQAVNPEEAGGARWERLRTLLLTIPLPGPNKDGRTIAQCAGTKDDTALWVIMGKESGDTATAYTDRGYADALTWFVRARASKCRKEASGRS